MTAVALVEPSTVDFDATLSLFQEYRRHYGHPGDDVRARTWLHDNVADRRMLAFLVRAAGSGEPAGICLVAPIPASLRLGEFWFVRDVYVAPAYRRTGLARLLLTAVRAAAIDRGAIRLSLQTEVDNTAALELYQRLGFEPVHGLRQLSLGLPPS